AALRQYGWGRERVSVSQGVNSRLHELQAAILRVRLRELDVDNARRARIAARYLEAFAGLPLGLPARIEGCGHAWHQFVVRSADRASLCAALDSEGVRTAIHYPVPVHRQPAFAGAATGPGGLPRTERLADTVLSLPMFPQLPDASVERVIDAVGRALGQPR
ncbi:MAG: DegT/DnrJ/EryC1/StrS family aminotransferase, partial [Burkholderiales bacterium]